MLHEHTDEDKFLQSAVEWQKKKPKTTDRLGKGIEAYLEERRPSYVKNASVVELWRQILPNGLQGHCGLLGISGGLLQLEVDPGPFMHEIQLLSEELLGHLQSCCPQAGIKKISLRPRRPGEAQAEEERW